MRSIRITLTALLFTLAVSTLAHAAAGLRIKCDPEGAEIRLNGKSYGTCPKNIPLPKGGSYTLILRKAIDGDSEYLYRQEINLADGDVLKVDATLQRTHTEAYQRRQREAQARTERERKEAQEREARLAAKVDYIDPSTGMKFVNINKGCFQMGDTFGDGYKDEKPVHEVCVDSFRLMKYEVTNAQYRKFKPDHDSGSYEGHSLNGDSQPVVMVSWEDATAFARWLSGQSGRTYRLPTEAEWEYAARGGTTTRNYWGNGKDDACGYANVHDQTSKRAFSSFTWENHNCDDGYQVTAPVGSFRPNAFGLYDMMGNVWEWTADWYGSDYYGQSPRNNPQGPSTRSGRVNRGGGWNYEPAFVRAANRHFDSPDGRIIYLGFRLLAPVR